MLGGVKGLQGGREHSSDVMIECTGLAKQNCTFGQSVRTFFWNEITF